MDNIGEQQWEYFCRDSNPNKFGGYLNTDIPTDLELHGKIFPGFKSEDYKTVLAMAEHLNKMFENACHRPVLEWHSFDLATRLLLISRNVE